ncbi:MAG: hypothetical protein WA919_22095 [Coleofasciculaceae cyanobacterium]
MKIQFKTNKKNQYRCSFPWLKGVLFPLYFLLFTSSAKALPGQSPDAVAAWLKGHPTLSNGIGTNLAVTLSENPAQKVSFQASVLPPGRIISRQIPGTISTERLGVTDRIRGVTFNRLEEYLRIIYGPLIYRDYTQATVVYDYPTPSLLYQGQSQNRPLLAAQQGQLLSGERYGYWLEITESGEGKAFNGQVTILRKDDLEKLEAELRNR